MIIILIKYTFNRKKEENKKKIYYYDYYYYISNDSIKKYTTSFDYILRTKTKGKKL